MFHLTMQVAILDRVFGALRHLSKKVLYDVYATVQMLTYGRINGYQMNKGAMIASRAKIDPKIKQLAAILASCI